MSPREVDKIAEAIADRFQTFGGGRSGTRAYGFNPVAEALKDKPLMFSAGVDVRDVINFVLNYDALRTDGDPE